MGNFKTDLLINCIKEVIDNRGKNPEMYFDNGKYPVIDNFLIQNEKYPKLASVTRYLNKSLFKNFLRNYVQKDDVLMTLVGNGIGNVTLAPSQEVAIVQNTIGLRCNDNMSNLYLYYYLLNSNKILRALNRGGAQPSINKNDVLNLEINFPEKLEEQNKIVKILSNYDDLIENNNRRIKILEEMAQKIYKEWFVDFKFPGHETTTIKKSVLSSIITPIKGKNITKGKAKIGNVPVVGGGMEPAYYHNVANTQAPVITISASGANAGFVNLYYKDIWASDCSYIDATMTNYIYYIYLLLKNNQIEITNMQLGAAQPHVYPRDLVNLKIKEFPIEAVTNFEKMVSPIFENIKILSIKNENLKQTRDILLPRLISGEINVENMEIK